MSLHTCSKGARRLVSKASSGHKDTSSPDSVGTTTPLLPIAWTSSIKYLVRFQVVAHAGMASWCASAFIPAFFQISQFFHRLISDMTYLAGGPGLHVDDGFWRLALESAHRSVRTKTHPTALTFRTRDRDMQGGRFQVVRNHHGRSDFPRLRHLCSVVSRCSLHEGDVPTREPWHRVGNLDAEHHSWAFPRTLRLWVSPSPF